MCVCWCVYISNKHWSLFMVSIHKHLLSWWKFLSLLPHQRIVTRDHSKSMVRKWAVSALQWAGTTTGGCQSSGDQVSYPFLSNPIAICVSHLMRWRKVVKKRFSTVLRPYTVITGGFASEHCNDSIKENCSDQHRDKGQR